MVMQERADTAPIPRDLMHAERTRRQVPGCGAGGGTNKQLRDRKTRQYKIF